MGKPPVGQPLWDSLLWARGRGSSFAGDSNPHSNTCTAKLKRQQEQTGECE